MSNRQVAKNALYLYLRTIVTTIVGIYTSRVVLQTLGIEDYGLYNVVGGVVGLFGFINGAMSGSTSRFITFELGKGDKQRLHDTFNSAMIVHLIISGIVLILAETVGLWFLYNKLVIPEGRMWAAQWVYQLSIISALLGVTQVPYDAVLIAHERFDVSAYISMFSTFAKLGVLYLVAYLPYDNLVSYAILILLITVLTRMFARFYCAKHFEESRFRWVVNRELLKPMLNFSGWQMFGNIGVIVGRQGKVLLVNLFYDVAANAAVGIGTTVSGAVNGLAYNMIQAFQPSITKSFASNDFESFSKNIENAACIAFLLFSLFSFPVILEMDFILKLWLGTVPEYTKEICILHLISSNVMMLSMVLNYALQTMGKNKNQNLFASVVNIAMIFVMYILLKIGADLVVAYSVIVLSIVLMLLNVYLLYRKNVGRNVASVFLCRVITRMFLFGIFSLCVLYVLKILIDEGFIRLCLLGMTSVCLSFLFVVVFFRKSFFTIIKDYGRAYHK